MSLDDKTCWGAIISGLLRDTVACVVTVSQTGHGGDKVHVATRHRRVHTLTV